MEVTSDGNPMELTPEIDFLFCTMTQAAIKMHEMGRPKKEFVVLASEIWDSMLMNDIEELKKKLKAKMIHNVKEWVKS